MPAAATKTPKTLRTKTIGEASIERAVRTVRTGSISVLEIAYAAAIPMMPQCRPITKAVMCATVNAIE
jgi:hypothetical protein